MSRSSHTDCAQKSHSNVEQIPSRFSSSTTDEMNNAWTSVEVKKNKHAKSSIIKQQKQQTPAETSKTIGRNKLRDSKSVQETKQQKLTSIGNPKPDFNTWAVQRQRNSKVHPQGHPKNQKHQQQRYDKCSKSETKNAWGMKINTIKLATEPQQQLQPRQAITSGQSNVEKNAWIAQNSCVNSTMQMQQNQSKIQKETIRQSKVKSNAWAVKIDSKVNPLIQEEKQGEGIFQQQQQFHQQRRDNEQNYPQSKEQQLQKSYHQQQGKQQQTSLSNGKKQSKKQNTKPTLTNMNIGDLIADILPEKRKGGPSPIGQRAHSSSRFQWNQSDSNTFPAPTTTSTSDFPALSNDSKTSMLNSGSSKQTFTKPVRILQKKQQIAEKNSSPTSPAVGSKKKKKNSMKTSATSNNVNSSSIEKVTASGELLIASRSQNTFARKHMVSAALKNPLASNILQPKMDVRRDDFGDEHDLIRLMQDGKMVVKNKGRQRIKPRKKKLTALKKKLLMERLKQWRELHPDSIDLNKKDGVNSNEYQVPSAQNDGTKESVDVAGTTSYSLCIYGFTQAEDLEEDDEYEEVLINLKEMANKVGDLSDIFIPQKLDESRDDTRYPSFVRFATSEDARTAIGCWNGLTIGGQRLEVFSLPVHDENVAKDEYKRDIWQDSCLSKESELYHIGVSVLNAKSSSVVVLENLLTDDDLEDDECMAESVEDIKSLAERFGKVLELQVKKGNGKDVYIFYEGDAIAIQIVVDQLKKITLGGSLISARLLLSHENDRNTANQGFLSPILLENVLTEEDVEDNECLEECISDIMNILQQYGVVSKLDTTEDGKVYVTYEGGPEVSLHAVTNLDGLCLGGQIVKATYLHGSNDAPKKDSCLVVCNILTEDDLEDEDCLEESLNDIRELAEQFGVVVEVEKPKEGTHDVIINFENKQETKAALDGFNGMIIGGQTISANLLVAQEKLPSVNSRLTSAEKKKDTTLSEVKMNEEGKPETMFSGDKRIPERFAECKRVPKIPNKGSPRSYAVLLEDETAKALLREMLSELMRLQIRAVQNKNAKARRRVVMGLREVARGVRTSKVKMIVMANNLDEYGVIDDKLQEILDLAREKEIPILFEFSKRVLGKAVGKNIKVAVVGIQNAEGAHQQFKQLAAMAQKLVHN